MSTVNYRQYQGILQTKYTYALQTFPDVLEEEKKLGRFVLFLDQIEDLNNTLTQKGATYCCIQMHLPTVVSMMYPANVTGVYTQR